MMMMLTKDHRTRGAFDIGSEWSETKEEAKEATHITSKDLLPLGTKLS